VLQWNPHFVGAPGANLLRAELTTNSPDQERKPSSHAQKAELKNRKSRNYENNDDILTLEKLFVLKKCKFHMSNMKVKCV